MASWLPFLPLLSFHSYTFLIILFYSLWNLSWLDSFGLFIPRVYSRFITTTVLFLFLFSGSLSVLLFILIAHSSIVFIIYRFLGCHILRQKAGKSAIIFALSLRAGSGAWRQTVNMRACRYCCLLFYGELVCKGRARGDRRENWLSRRRKGCKQRRSRLYVLLFNIWLAVLRELRREDGAEEAERKADLCWRRNWFRQIRSRLYVVLEKGIICCFANWTR